MSQKRAIRVCRELTPEEKERLRTIREQVELERDEIIARGRELKREHDLRKKDAQGSEDTIRTQE